MGNSVVCRLTVTQTPVHPHVHGELNTTISGTVYKYGSSPRAWGTRKEYTLRVVTVRFIPTCMGNSLHTRFPGRRFAVHPHVHGELVTVNQTIGRDAGSSPRAWGTRIEYLRFPEYDRFIPTCMGNSGFIACLINSFPVHPHVHGELESLTFLPPS